MNVAANVVNARLVKQAGVNSVSQRWCQPEPITTMPTLRHGRSRGLSLCGCRLPVHQDPGDCRLRSLPPT